MRISIPYCSVPLALILLFGVPSQHHAQEPPKPLDRPNVLIVIIDDLGCRDVGVDGFVVL